MDQITQQQEEITEPITKPSKKGSTSRRSFLQKGMAVGGASAIGAGLLSAGLLDPASVFAGERTGKALTRGDTAILRFLSALEILETDLWQQYNELGGIQDKEVPGGSGNPLYTAAINVLDTDMSQYIHDNTDDEISHFTFINAYLVSRGGPPVSLEKFRTLQGSTATGADKNAKRLTNLLQLTVDTTWWTRYRSDSGNPDLGDTFPPAIPGLLEGRFKAIPQDDSDTAGSTVKKPSDHLQAIANTAGFHFGFIEQGGTSLYPSLAQRVTDVEVLRVLLSIGPSETMHFQTWQDKAGNAPQVTDPTNNLTFPDLNAVTKDPELFQTNLIMPEPTVFLKRSFPKVSIIRPTKTEGAANGALKALTDDGLFMGQSDEFFTFMKGLADAADAARRGGA